MTKNHIMCRKRHFATDILSQMNKKNKCLCFKKEIKKNNWYSTYSQSFKIFIRLFDEKNY